MRKICLISLLITFFVLNFAGYGFTINLEKNNTKEKKALPATIHLFNGKDLDGWYTFLQGKGRNNDPNQVFTVRKGVIRISGADFGCITTNNEYGNYRLDVEIKWGKQTCAPRLNNARDSGILLHSTGEDGAFSGIWMHSIECQLIEGGTGDLLVVGDETTKFSLTCPVEPVKQDGSYVFKIGGNLETIHGGRVNWFGRDPLWKDVTGFRGAKDLEKSLGKWNKLTILAHNNEIEIYLNGTLVNQAIDVHPQKGRIQIQSEGAEILFKRIDLSPLQDD